MHAATLLCNSSDEYNYISTVSHIYHITTYPSESTLSTERKRSKVAGRNWRACACALGAISSFSPHSRPISSQMVVSKLWTLCLNVSLPLPRVPLQ